MVLTGRVPGLGKCNESSPFSAFFHESDIFYGKAPLQDEFLAHWHTLPNLSVGLDTRGTRSNDGPYIVHSIYVKYAFQITVILSQYITLQGYYGKK